MSKEGEHRGTLNRHVDNIDWYGEVKDLRTDGMIEVLLPSGRVTLERQEHLSILVEEGEPPLYDDEGPLEMDGVDEADGEWEDEPYDGQSLTGSEGEYLTDQLDAETASIRMAESERDEWEHLEEEEEHDEVEGLTTPPPETTPAAVESIAAPLPSSTSSSTPTTVERPLTDTPPIPDGLAPAPSAIASSSRPAPAAKDAPEWERFAILEEADATHHFFEQPVGKPNAAFLTRLQKEFKVLASALPDTILVRSYEDRMDLLRVLIIGPPGTPYVDAPHLIDFYLDPAKFPFEPPKAHFHSWTSGRGRCSPNLYEEGKVCLSILGTWEGERNESWK
jgi:ubiquitin-conjugating enzyme E2 O